MTSLIQVSSNAIIYISSTQFFGELRTIRDIGGALNTSNVITISTTGGTFSDGTSVRTLDTPYATLTMNPSTSQIMHAFPFTYNESVEVDRITNQGSLDIYVSTNIYDSFYVANTISSSGFIDSASIFVQRKPAVIVPELISTSIHLGNIYTSTYYIHIDKLNSTGYVMQSNLNSTIAGLGTFGYISSPDLMSTVKNLGTFGYISASCLVSTVISMKSSIVQTAASLLFMSTNMGLSATGYISSTQLTSCLMGLANTSYISSTQLQSTVANLQGLGLVSTVLGLGVPPYSYISSASLQSTVAGVLLNESVSLISTVTALGTPYVSTSGFTSSVNGLSSAPFNYISTAYLLSSVTGFLNNNPFTPDQLASTINNLGTVGYYSTGTLTSTFQGLGAAGYISSSAPFYAPTVTASYPYYRTNDLNAAGSAELVLYSNLLGATLLQRVNTLGSLGYLSTTQFAGPYLATQTAAAIASLPAYPTRTTQATAASATTNYAYIYNGTIVGSSYLNITGSGLGTANVYSFSPVTANNFYAQNTSGGNGQFYADGTQLTSSSDRRLKKDIVAMSNVLEKINALEGVYYTKKSTGQRQVGFIAQDVEGIFPNLVLTDGSAEKMKSIQYESINVALLEAIKELDIQCDALLAKANAKAKSLTTT